MAVGDHCLTPARSGQGKRLIFHGMSLRSRVIPNRMTAALPRGRGRGWDGASGQGGQGVEELGVGGGLLAGQVGQKLPGMAGAAAALGAQAGGAAQAGVVADPRLDGVANGGVGDSLAQANVHRTSLPDRTPAGPTSQGCSAVGAFRQPAGGLDNEKLFQMRIIVNSLWE